MKIDQRMQPIRLILSDVDGVLTNGDLSFDNQGIEAKTFHVHKDELNVDVGMLPQTPYMFANMLACWVVVRAA